MANFIYGSEQGHLKGKNKGQIKQDLKKHVNETFQSKP
jgi:hypothetical protein